MRLRNNYTPKALRTSKTVAI